ncbi:GNAT family N-acetyltransferase [Pseudorhodobacter sp.]|uniref:GNAT family N-acetyltransferase n=1 Tax=Pseudorhodobacter sp. TaxID=1934400 RepID=UPI00264A1127|nr:GNAT family N-acetyltransferase [Pseudorhodobacter sp.]MDN5786155.1 GNAT family N-acetyltransferase [Pseudorhodobacter sp.]
MTAQIAVTRDIATCLELRRLVFMVEQGVSEADERDDLDAEAVHLLATVGGVPIGSARLLTGGAMGKIGRVCVLSSHRGMGLGAALICASVEQFRTMLGIETVKLGAQTHAVGFYEKLGFVAIGPVYDDAGIPHRDMIISLS